MSRWHRFDFPDLPEGAFRHVGDRRIQPQGGGGGGGVKYENLERLYGLQEEQGRDLQALSRNLVFPQFNKLVAEANDYGSAANRERAAATSAADMASARASGRQAVLDEAESYGIGIGDGFNRALAKNDLFMAGADAAGRTGARDRVDQMGFARMQDAAGMIAGTPTQATSALNSAMSGATQVANMGAQQQAMNNAAMGNIARAGINLYGASQNGVFNAADGGQVPVRMARGGILGAMSASAPPPPSGAVGPSMANQLAGAAAPGVMKYGANAGGQAISKVGQLTGNQGMVEFGNGMMTPVGKGVDPAVGQFFQSPDTAAYAMADKQVTGAMGGLETGATASAAEGAAAGGAAAAEGAAAAAAAEGAAAAAAAEVGAATAATSGLGATGAALGAAMPWVGAAMLAASAFGLLRDGGEVKPKVPSKPRSKTKTAAIGPGSTSRKGGKVHGPGGPKDDRVPALLSAGEFVMPYGTVQKFGLAAMENMRQAGLQHEKKLGIRRA